MSKRKLQHAYSLGKKKKPKQQHLALLLMLCDEVIL